MADTRTDTRETPVRNWTVVLYPDDLPSDWVDKIKDIKCKAFLSPPHNEDNNADGTPKKLHYHLIMMFDSGKRFHQVKGIFEGLFGTSQSGSVIGVAMDPKNSRVHDKSAMVRYLCHLDNPEKAQYDVNDIQAFNGADVMEALKHSLSETQAAMIAMEEFIEEHCITELRDFSAAIRYEHSDWYLILTTKATTYFNAFIRSLRHSLQDEAQRRPVRHRETVDISSNEEKEEEEERD